MGVTPYCIGTPNPLMIRTALRHLGGHAASSVLIGDQMETDIVAGMEAGMPTVLVLTGMARQDQIARLAYQPTAIILSIAAIDLMA